MEWILYVDKKETLFFEYPTQKYYSLKERLSMLLHEYSPVHFLLAFISHHVTFRALPEWISPRQRATPFALLLLASMGKSLSQRASNIAFC